MDEGPVPPPPETVPDRIPPPADATTPPTPGPPAGPKDAPAAAQDAVARRAAEGPSEAPPKRKPRERPHPYRDEKSTPAELRHDPRKVTAFWFLLATAMAVVGMALDRRFNPNPVYPDETWVRWTLVPLFAGLGLLGFGILRNPKWERFTMVGWLLFAFYWGLTAIDLFLSEGYDYVNFLFAIVGVYFFTYLAYHQWLSVARGVDNKALHFLNVSTFVAAGSYFLIDKIETVRIWLIEVVSNQTHWMLNLFGQGTQKGLQFVQDPSRGAPTTDGAGPSTFLYPHTVNTCPDGSTYTDVPYEELRQYSGPDQFEQWCADNLHLYADNWWEKALHYAPDGEHLIGPVTIILACTALQSIMLFVGLFMGTDAKLKDKLLTSLWVGALVYVLNLLRNTGIIWFFGQGKASFWVMHNAIGKGGSLVAMVAIAFIVFRTFPAFFHGLVSVLDLPERDGPIERTLRIGRRRPESGA